MAAAEALDDHRLVVASATYDEMDRRRDELDVSRESVATEQTEPADNTHPYLMKYADRYAHDDADATADSAGPTFVGVRPPAEFAVGQKVTYTFKGNAGTSEAVVVKVVYDDERHPHYIIRLASGKEKQTRKEQLDAAATAGATDENGEAIGPTNCVDFKVNATPLFKALYAGKWDEARERLQSHPEDARVWVARYANSDKMEIRWQLLPLHLLVALGGHAEEEDLADDDNTPPLHLLAALLEAHPQATQCTDDQSMIPLHSAIRGNASLAVIANLLDANPASVYKKDSRGRNAFVLAEKVYGKQGGNEDEEREGRHAKLTELLSEAARRVSSPAASPARSPPYSDKEKEGGLEGMEAKKLHRLQNENLALRRENAELRHRAEIHERMLLQLVDKLQEYEEMRSVDIENYNEIFGSAGELAGRREGILTSISEDEEEKEAEEETQVAEEKPVGGSGAYQKRLERHTHTTPTGKVGVNIISPISTMSTDSAELGSAMAPSVLLPKLDSCAEDDAKNNPCVEENVEVVLEGDVDEAKEGVAEGEESDDANARGQDIFRSRNEETEGDAPDETQAPNQKSDVEQESDSAKKGLPEAPPTAFDREVAEKAAKLQRSAESAPAEAQVTVADAVGKAALPESPVASSDPEVAEESDSPKSMVAEVVEVFETMASKNNGPQQKEADAINVGKDDSPSRKVLPVLSYEEEEQLQVE